MRKMFAWLLLFVAMATLVCATQPTQQYNKILLTPFYVNSMTQNVPYNYNVSVITPDGISEVKTAILTLDAWINPTRTFNAWMNGVQCNTKNYTISTTYASAGRGVVTFDCTNAILPNRANNVTFVVTGGNIGSSTAWLDLTYMNAPVGDVLLHGTEYVSGDNGKLFLQFLDSDQRPVNNSECFLSLWYPNSSVMFNNTLMTYLDEGLYFKNFLVPSIDGVYPASAKCYRPLKFAGMILYNVTWDNFDSNSWLGGGNWSTCELSEPNCQNGWDYDPATTSIVSNAGAGTGGCYGNTGYCAKITGSYGYIERGFPKDFIEGTLAYNVTFRFKISGFQGTETAEIYLFDGNWHKIFDINLAGGYSNNQWYNISYYADSSDYNLETLLFGVYAYTMPSTNDIIYIDDVYINYHIANITLTNDTDYQILRGSGEVHVSKLYSQLNNTVGDIADGVWNYPNRTLTAISQSFIGGTEYSTTETRGKVVARMTDNAGEPVTGGNCTLTVFFNNSIVLNQSPMIEYIGTPQGVYYLDFNLSGIAGVYPYAVDCLKSGKNYYMVSSYHIFGNTPEAMANAVWNYSVRNLTFYENFTVPQVDLTNYSFIESSINASAFDVKSNITSKLDSMDSKLDSILSAFGSVASNVWSYITRSLTYYPDMTNYTLIAENQYNYSSRFDAVDSGIYGLNISIGVTPFNVWSYPVRNLTFYENFTVPQVDLTNYSLIESSINASALDIKQNVSLRFDVVDSAISNLPASVWNYSSRSLTYYPIQVDLTNYTLVAETVWGYDNRSLTYYQVNNITPQDVWGFVNRTLTYYEVNNLTADDVWVYSNRTLTYYPDVNSSVIAEQVWNVTGRYVHGTII